MSPHMPILQPTGKHEATERRFCSAPFEKGGYGGFAFASDQRHLKQRQQQQQQQQLQLQEQEQEQEQIPLNPPFAKGEAGWRAAGVRLVLP